MSAKVEAKMENGVIKINAEADIVEIAKDAAAKSDNSFDDHLVKILEMAKDNLDWKGYAKSLDD